MLATAASMSVASPAFAGTHTVRRGETLSAVASRYGDRVPFIQLWDLPNRTTHWGDAPTDPATGP